MLLAVDVGNTHTVVGVYRGDRLVVDWRLTSSPARTADECWMTVKGFCADRGIAPADLTEAGISSVVPDLTEVYVSMVRDFLHLEPVVIDSSLDLGIQIQYRDPRSVGADRLCNAVAGFCKFGGPLIVIDFGTATTFDVVDRKGNYLGGTIMLGLESAAQELHRRAARLPKIELRFPERVIGRDTESSMQAGILFGTVEAVEGMVRRINLELGEKAKVIATGGLSGTVARQTKAIDGSEPTLVLDGIRLICERVLHPSA